MVHGLRHVMMVMMIVVVVVVIMLVHHVMPVMVMHFYPFGRALVLRQR